MRLVKKVFGSFKYSLLLLTFFLLIVACSKAPVTGRSQLILISELPGSYSDNVLLTGGQGVNSSFLYAYVGGQIFYSIIYCIFVLFACSIEINLWLLG